MMRRAVIPSGMMILALSGAALAQSQGTQPRSGPGAPAQAQTHTPARPAQGGSGDLQPAVQTSTRSWSAPPAPKARGQADQLQLGTTEISGNRELPKLMYIVPWQRPQVGTFTGRPPNSLVDEALTPVDRGVFERQNRYYAALAARSGGGQAGPVDPAAGTAVPAARGGSSQTRSPSAERPAASGQDEK